MRHDARMIAARNWAAAFALAGLLGAAHAALGQAIPAAEASPISTGFSIPSLAGSLQWGVTASESLTWGYYSGNNVAEFTNLSGDLAYLSNSAKDPFGIVASGGRSWATSSAPSYGFVDLGMSQSVTAGRWYFVFSDNVNYLPGTPTVGLSGVAGVGDLGVAPAPVQVGPDSGQGVLTNYSPEITNTAAGSVQRPITGKTSLTGSASYTVLRFLDGQGSTGNFGVESDAVTGSAGLSHRVSGRDTIAGNYSYSSYIYLNNLSNGIPEPNFVSQTASMSYTHQVSPRFALSIAGGPEWVMINFSNQGQTLNAFVDASANYSGEFSHLSLAYVRNTNSGYGVIGGAISDSVTFAASRVFARVWNGAVNLGYAQTEGLPTPGVPAYDFHTFIESVQISRALARSFSAYASYTVEDQSHASAASTTDLFDGFSQTLGFGVTYSPTSKHFGRP